MTLFTRATTVLILLLGSVAVARGDAGVMIDVPDPITAEASRAVLTRLRQLASRPAGDDQRPTAVLRFAATSEEGGGDFEDALRLARGLRDPELRGVRTVAWLAGEVRGHAVLVVLACGSIYGQTAARLGPPGRGTDQDATIAAAYRAIAQSAATVPPGLVEAWIEPEAEVSRVADLSGDVSVLAGAGLDAARQAGEVANETVLHDGSGEFSPTIATLRSVGAALGTAEDEQQLADRLDLPSLRPLVAAEQPAAGVRVAVTGPIRGDRVRRWIANLTGSTGGQEPVNRWMIQIDSAGGSIDHAIALSELLARPPESIAASVGFVPRQAAGDAALVAIACERLTMAPDATLGGPGAQALSPAAFEQRRAAIERIAEQTGRPAALLLGMLQPSRAVHRYEDRTTGRIEYRLEDPGAARAEDGDWVRGPRIDFAEGIGGNLAVELGLADAVVADATEAARSIGLTEVPADLNDRPLVRFVERIGRNGGLAVLVLLIGFSMVSTEASAPGLGIPGLVAMLCFAFFVWSKFLAGTAEWAEAIAFGLGLVFIGIEIFVVPGFGVFGIAGLALTVIGVVLMSQTFVIPRNSYQLTELTKGVWTAIGGLTGVAVGLLLMRRYFPAVASASGLAMGVPDPTSDMREHIAHFDHLSGKTGVTTSPLRPAGKARFGDQLVAVVSDGRSVDSGDAVRVVSVLGNRIVVVPLEEPAA